ncbi:MAG: bifunctional glutamate N-acetyltransferase/amino-acid acetyltransferase ArgJ [Ruminococcaceae bacterium]|nr:bifunctional glutamate N-acetyltransferase/amino-acid acetyltransferase ArgJ [Oscillospiraceae bacterium]
MEKINLTKIDGGVCAPLGFKAYGIHSGLRKNTDRLDLAMIKADKQCTAAGVFTKNKVFAAPVGVTREHLENGTAQVVICNSGNANACTPDGYEKANATCAALAETLGIPEDDVIVCSTGVIGLSMDISPILNGIPTLLSSLDPTAVGSDKAATAIMTTDTKKKEFSYSFEVGGKTVKIGGICKGSGMIHPNMGTMLCFITTDCAISSSVLRTALLYAVKDTYNMVTVDGDTSTNDTVTVMASGLAGNTEICCTECEEYKEFAEALKHLCMDMALAIAADGEGATKLLICNVTGAKSDDDARILAKAVVSSSLVKTAMYGADANWGRIICALGYSGADIDTSKINITFVSAEGVLPVCKNGGSYPFDEDFAKKVLTRDKIEINCDMNDGEFAASAFGCDLTYEYVRINGDYRS